MTVLKRSAILAAVVGFFALMFAAPAGAQPYTRTPTLSINVQIAKEGGTVTVTGRDYSINASVTLTLHSKSYNLGTATADASGGFTRTVNLPAGVLGDHTITGTAKPVSYDVNTASVSFRITADGTEGAGAGSGGSGGAGGSGAGSATGGLSNTGVAVMGIGLLGLVLLAGGGAMLYAGRRRGVSA